MSRLDQLGREKGPAPGTSVYSLMASRPRLLVDILTSGIDGTTGSGMNLELVVFSAKRPTLASGAVIASRLARAVLAMSHCTFAAASAEKPVPLWQGFEEAKQKANSVYAHRDNGRIE